MSRIRSTGNKETEFALMKILRQNRIKGWRRHLPLAGRPDFAFQKEKLAIFVDGCFWHGCPRCYRRPTSRKRYWDAKYERNKRRDREVARKLRERGWNVLRIWEHQIKGESMITRKIKKLLERRRD